MRHAKTVAVFKLGRQESLNSVDFGKILGGYKRRQARPRLDQPTTQQLAHYQFRGEFYPHQQLQRIGRSEGAPSMKIEPGQMVPLGYGKYFRSDRIVGLEPIEEGRGPGQRTRVYIEQLATPIVASRSEGAILSDMVEMPKEITKIREQRELLSDLVDTISEINPLLRSIIRDQGKWDLDRLEERIRDVLRQDEE
jgi:hypothetical protein